MFIELNLKNKNHSRRQKHATCKELIANKRDENNFSFKIWSNDYIVQIRLDGRVQLSVFRYQYFCTERKPIKKYNTGRPLVKNTPTIKGHFLWKPLIELKVSQNIFN